MATISKHISAIRGLVKQYQNDTLLTDEFLYFLLTGAAAIVNKRKAEKEDAYSKWNTPTYCVGLTVSPLHPCECEEDLGCKIARTKYKIPRPLMTSQKSLIVVTTLDHVQIPEISPEQAETIQHDEVKRDTFHYYMQNNYIYVVNSSVTKEEPFAVVRPKAILVKGFWADISDWEGIKLCDKEGAETKEPCFDKTKHEFPIDTDSDYMAYDLVLQKLGIPMSVKSDDTNNMNPEI